MLTLPKITTRDAVPIIGIREKVPLADIAPTTERSFSRLFAWCGARGIAPAGAPYVRYLVIDRAGDLQLEFGMPMAEPLAGADGFVAGELPGGRYASVTYLGPYDDLPDVNAMLIGWAREKGIVWDGSEDADGDHFACRLEIHQTDLMSETDPNQWKTTVAIKLAD